MICRLFGELLHIVVNYIVTLFWGGVKDADIVSVFAGFFEVYIDDFILSSFGIDNDEFLHVMRHFN